MITLFILGANSILGYTWEQIASAIFFLTLYHVVVTWAEYLCGSLTLLTIWQGIVRIGGSQLHAPAMFLVIS